MIGKIYPPGTLFLLKKVGSSKNGKVEYRLSTGANTGIPIVHSSKTGKKFVLRWGDIIALAVDAGIDSPDQKKKKGGAK